jgi:hypothetical protein
MENLYRLEIGIVRFSHGVCFQNCRQAALERILWPW